MARGKRSRLKDQKASGGKKLKEPSPPASVSTQQLRPIFCLEHLRGDYCLTKCEVKEKARFAETLHRLSQRTWADIQATPRHKKGCETISRDALRVPLPRSVTEDVTFLAIRFDGKKAMVGYRNQRVFHVLWLDRNFTLYNHGS